MKIAPSWISHLWRMRDSVKSIRMLEPVKVFMMDPSQKIIQGCWCKLLQTYNVVHTFRFMQWERLMTSIHQRCISCHNSLPADLLGKDLRSNSKVKPSIQESYNISLSLGAFCQTTALNPVAYACIRRSTSKAYRRRLLELNYGRGAWSQIQHESDSDFDIDETNQEMLEKADRA